MPEKIQLGLGLQHFRSRILSTTASFLSDPCFPEERTNMGGGAFNGRDMIPTSVASLSEGKPRCASKMNTNLRARIVCPTIWPDFRKARQAGSPPGTLLLPPVVEETQGCELWVCTKGLRRLQTYRRESMVASQLCLEV